MKNRLSYGNVSLRPLEPEDIELLYRWENNMEIWDVSNTRTPFSKHILAKYILDSRNDIYETRQLRLIIQNNLDEPVGAVDLFDFDPYHLRAGIGILVHNTEHQNLGYATNALIAICEYARESLGLKQLFANISTENLKSIHLFEKTGFVKIGVKKSWIKTYAGWKDELFLQKILSNN